MLWIMINVTLTEPKDDKSNISSPSISVAIDVVVIPRL